VDHQKFDLEKATPKRIDSFSRHCVLALRSNIARQIKGMDHRDFCVRLADRSMLQWFIQVGRVDGVKAFAKSTSDRFAHIIDEAGLRAINARLTALLAGVEQATGPIDLGLKKDISFDDIYFDSTCLKAPIHFPVDWILLRDATRTLMKATRLIRREGLHHRMPQEPLAFLSDINTLCMKMTAKYRTKDGRKHRKSVLRDMKKLSARIAKHARNHLKILATRADETDLKEGQVRQIAYRIQSIPDVQVLKRGKSGAEIEFGNNLWLGETREGLIIDYLLEKEKTSDPKQIKPALERLKNQQNLPLKNAWGDRGIHSAANEKLLESHGLRSGLCPRNVSELSERLEHEPGMREGLKRRAGTEARVSIIIRDFMGKEPRARGFKHRQMMVGWAVLSHNLWVLARLETKSEAEEIPEAA